MNISPPFLFIFSLINDQIFENHFILFVSFLQYHYICFIIDNYHSLFVDLLVLLLYNQLSTGKIRLKTRDAMRSGKGSKQAARY